jgi:hypothetical protein
MKHYSLSLFFILGLIVSIIAACQYSEETDRSIITEQSNTKEEIVAAQKERVTVAVISDLNSQYGATDYEPEIDKAIELIITQWQPDLVLGGGDVIAGQKQSLTEEQIKAMWSAFDVHVARPLRKNGIPYAFTIGNHDGSGAIKNKQFVFARERDLAAAYWNDPNHNSGINFVDKANFPFYFSFLQDDIFYLVWDASTHIISDRQLAWIEKSLSSNTAQEASMRIAIGHLPLDAIAQQKNKPGEYLAEAQQLQSLLEKYDVHTYISGHHHAYYPGKKGILQLLHAGALGQGARQLIDSNLLPQNTVTLIDIEPLAQTTAYRTYNIRTLEIIEASDLPRFIIGKNGLILRNDISATDLTTAEKQSCLQKLATKLCQP